MMTDGVLVGGGGGGRGCLGLDRSVTLLGSCSYASVVDCCCCCLCDAYPSRKKFQQGGARRRVYHQRAGSKI